MNNVMVYLTLIIAIVLLIASMVVPYYTDASGAEYGVYNKCLGYTNNSIDCGTMEALPVVTVILGIFTLIMLAAQNRVQATAKIVNMLGGIVRYTIGFNTAFMLAFVFTVIFSIATLSTQLSTPISMGTSTVSLSDQSQKACNANPITFKDGMALSAASTALFVAAFLIFISKAEDVGRFMSLFNQK
jgi:hypothetical protein